MDRKIFLLKNGYLCWLAGGYIASKKTAIRLVIGAWCLLTLVLLNVYNSTLISYITTTQNAQVFANSIEEVAAGPNINLVITKNLGVDSVLSVSTTCTNRRRY